MFLLNSRYPRFCASLFQGYSFSRSYRGILPSSFTKILPSTFVFSTCPPVSVCSTVFYRKFFPGKSKKEAELSLSASFLSFSSFSTHFNIPIKKSFRRFLRDRVFSTQFNLTSEPLDFR